MPPAAPRHTCQYPANMVRATNCASPMPVVISFSLLLSLPKATSFAAIFYIWPNQQMYKNLLLSCLSCDVLRFQHTPGITIRYGTGNHLNEHINYYNYRPLILFPYLSNTPPTLVQGRNRQHAGKLQAVTKAEAV